MANFSVLLYRMYFAAKDLGVASSLRRWPSAMRGLRQFKALIKRKAWLNQQAWVIVQAGLSQGMWMQLRLSTEVAYWRGIHEPDVQIAISAVVRPGDVVYDIGAHVGSIALGTARLVGDVGRVVAFDGDPENVMRLRENISRNGLEERLQTVHAAIWSSTRNDGISFRRGTTVKSQGGVEAEGKRPVLGSGEVIRVPAITLDDFIATGGPLPQLVKVDVEGGEYEVLLGGKSLFTSQRPLIIAEVHHQQAADQIGVWLGEYQYRGQWKIPKENFPRYLFAWPNEYDGIGWMRRSADARK